MRVKLMNALRRICGLHLYTVQVGHYAAGGEVPELPSDFEIRILTPAEIRYYVNSPRLDFRESFVNAALARGDVTIGAFKDDRLVGYSWRALRGPVPHSAGWEVIWNPGLVYRYKAFTLQEHRGLHINEALDKLVDRHLGEHGHPMGLSFVDVTNLPSLRSLARKGRQRIGYAGHFEWRTQRFAFRTPGCRAVGFEFRDAKSVDVHLSSSAKEPTVSV